MFPKRRRGFTTIAAIFLLVILASLGAFIAEISGTHQIGSALDFMGAEAYFAARAGIDWEVPQAINAAVTSATCSDAGTSTNIGVVNNMYVTVVCQITARSGGAIDEGGLKAIYKITSTACNVPVANACPGLASSNNYVERRLTSVVDATSDEQ